MRKAERLFTLSDILGLHNHLGALMLDGHIFQLSREKVGRDEPDHTELYGARRRVEPVAQANDLFQDRLHTHSEAVDAFRAQVLHTPHQKRRRLSEELSERVGQHDCLRFVLRKLVPHLKNLAEDRVMADRTLELENIEPLKGVVDMLAGLDRTPSDLLHDVVDGDALFLGQSVYNIEWVNGNVRPRACFVQSEGESYSVQTQKRRHLMTLEGIFKKKLQSILRGHIFDEENERLLAQARKLEADLRAASHAAREDRLLYRDRDRCVMLGSNHALFCCQDIPPFVMECSDRRLRLFERVRVGIKIDTLDPRALFYDGAYVMQDYEHVFVSNYIDVGHLCMGDMGPLWKQFGHLPLQEMIVELLNAARLVICAGNFDLGDGLSSRGYHSDQVLHQPTISIKEARQKGFPIYRYYRTEWN